MMNVLLESRAARPRRVTSAMTSALLHGALLAAVVALTHPRASEARAGDAPLPHPPVYVPLPERQAQERRDATTRAAEPSLSMQSVPPTITVPVDVPDHLPPVDVGPVLPPDEIRIGGAGERTGLSVGSGLSGLPVGTGEVVDASVADRAPRLLGRPAEPRYPSMLRAAGVEGRVVVQFVVDTLGRVEMETTQVMESPHPLFADAVRAVLERYHFVPGEAAGHRVRTRVQIPFEFTLTR